MFISILFFLTTTLNANECKVNGCGPEYFKSIPDKVKPFSRIFRSYCNNHDKCYSQCINSCNSSGKPKYCNIEKIKNIKKRCDATFLFEMETACKKTSKPKLCKKTAITYYTAVKLFGSGSIKGNKGESLAVMVAKKTIEKPKQILKNGYKKLKPSNKSIENTFLLADPSPESTEYIDWFGIDEDKPSEK